MVEMCQGHGEQFQRLDPQQPYLDHGPIVAASGPLGAILGAFPGVGTRRRGARRPTPATENARSPTSALFAGGDLRAGRRLTDLGRRTKAAVIRLAITQTSIKMRSGGAARDEDVSLPGFAPASPRSGPSPTCPKLDPAIAAERFPAPPGSSNRPAGPGRPEPGALPRERLRAWLALPRERAGGGRRFRGRALARASTDRYQDPPAQPATHQWRACETWLNGLDRCRTTLDGLDIDFLHIRSPEPNALPLLMTHGWPGSAVEYRKVIGPVTDRAAYGGDRAHAFHLILSTLPGFGFSAKPTETGGTLSRSRCLDRPYGPSRIRPVGGARRGSRLRRHWRDRPPCPRRPRRDAPELRRVRPHPRRDRRSHARRASRARQRQVLLGQPVRLRQGTVHPSADGRLLRHPPASPPGSTPCSRTPVAPPATPRPASPSTRCSTTSWAIGCQTGCLRHPAVSELTQPGWSAPATTDDPTTLPTGSP